MLVIQEEGGVRRTVERGLSVLRELLPTVASARRTEAPASSLVLGLQCGGSDGYSGITANPALGIAVDLLVAQGGTAVLGETPEVYGAEHLLVRRAVERQVGEELIERIRWWEAYSASHGATMDNNPTPGNKAGGLTTIFEKSLGAVAKGGSTPLTAVYRYAEQVSSRGLVLMDTPGNDPVSLTGIVAGGATVCAFTTGRGSVYGCKPSPCIKIAASSELYGRLNVRQGSRTCYLRGGARGRQRQEDEERGSRPRGRGVRSLDAGAGPLSAAGPCHLGTARSKAEDSVFPRSSANKQTSRRQPSCQVPGRLSPPRSARYHLCRLSVPNPR